MVKVFYKNHGQTWKADVDFRNQLTSKLEMNPQEVSSEMKSEFIIAFVPIVSRPRTDIEVALNKIPESCPVVLVVLHHTLDPYFDPPDSRRCVNRRNVFTVDCLFYEDRGLLKCHRNEEALRAVKDHLEASYQIPEMVWRMLIVGLTLGATRFRLPYAIFLVVVLFLLLAFLDNFFHVKWVNRVLVICFLLVIIFC
ncbi:hypothetical protein AMEX_G26221 [Astyanax mexicanus]|uniref:Uncharacterized protein n=1 Tax=Astyanax mexicanus TaxID=7994 RepID=A0A8T2KRL6_ASTMX|nr:hypothetical protein AMEX_G26221 [Astyanax mexicanus]